MIDITELIQNAPDAKQKPRIFKNPYKDLIEAYANIEEHVTDVDTFMNMTDEQLQKYREEQIKAQL